jgi:hypothetical protein
LGQILEHFFDAQKTTKTDIFKVTHLLGLQLHTKTLQPTTHLPTTTTGSAMKASIGNSSTSTALTCTSCVNQHNLYGQVVPLCLIDRVPEKTAD